MYSRHRVERRCYCTLCLNSFSCQSELKIHELSHTEIKLYKNNNPEIHELNHKEVILTRLLDRKITGLCSLFKNTTVKKNQRNYKQFSCFLYNKHVTIGNKNSHIESHCGM